MERIDKPEEFVISEFDGVCSAGVYVGSMDSLKCVTRKLKWHEEKDANYDEGINVPTLTLKEISEQLDRYVLITVIVEGPMYGEIYRYGNYSGGDWWKIGTLDGYA